MSPEVAVDDSQPAVGEEDQEERAAEDLHLVVVRLRDLHLRAMPALAAQPEML